MQQDRSFVAELSLAAKDFGDQSGLKMLERSNVQSITDTLSRAAAGCTAVLLMTIADVRAQASTQVAPFSLVAAELDLLVSDETRAAKVDGVSYFVIDDRGAVVRGPIVIVEGSPAAARQAFEKDFRAAILKAAPFEPLPEFVGKVLVLRLSTCGSGAEASCGHQLKATPPKMVEGWRSRR